MFFLNLYHADPTNYGAYTPGVGIPDQIASASGSGLTVVLHMKSAGQRQLVALQLPLRNHPSAELAGT